MDNWIIWIIAAGAIIVPLVISAGTIRNLILGWRLPTTWISALPVQGWVSVIGRIRGDPIQSRLSKTECAFWQLEVKEYQSGGRGSGHWRPVHKETSGSFTVDDMTGRINILDGNKASILANERVMEKLDQDTKLTLQNLGVKTKGILGFDKRLRVYERMISVDEEILVLGKIKKSELGEHSISISGNSIAPRVISNLGKPETLKTLLWQAVWPMSISILIGAGIIAYSLYLVLK